MPQGSSCRKSFRNRGIKLSFAAFLISSAALAADDAGLLRCRAIADAAARLACYDALPLTGGAGKAAPGQAKGETSQRAPQFTAAEFGLEDQIMPSLSLEKIESSIPGHFEGWGPNQRIRLANGQVWQVADGSSRFYSLDNPKVIVTRGTLGAFYLNLDGENWTVRVRRVR
ncbi:MAG TPA: hypothetical protein VF814_01570 [Casimicrobiaceae bacterium]